MTNDTSRLRPGMVIIALGLQAALACQAGDLPGALSRGQTKKVIQEAEARMADYRLTHPLEVKRSAEGASVPNLVDDAGSPLNGKIGIFKAKLKSVERGAVAAAVQPEAATGTATQPADSPDVQTVVGTFDTKLKKYYDYDRLYDEHRQPKKAFKRQVDELRHELRVKLPPGHRLPAKLHGKFKATARVTAVHWDHSAVLPVLIIDCDVVESKDLGLKRTGAEEVNGQKRRDSDDGDDDDEEEEDDD